MSELNNIKKEFQEFNDIKKEFQELKKRNASPAEIGALINRMRTHREKLFNEFNQQYQEVLNHE